MGDAASRGHAVGLVVLVIVCLVVVLGVVALVGVGLESLSDWMDDNKAATYGAIGLCAVVAVVLFVAGSFGAMAGVIALGVGIAFVAAIKGG
jgi:hypothetical protein